MTETDKQSVVEQLVANPNVLMFLYEHLFPSLDVKLQTQPQTCELLKQHQAKFMDHSYNANVIPHSTQQAKWTHRGAYSTTCGTSSVKFMTGLKSAGCTLNSHKALESPKVYQMAQNFVQHQQRGAAGGGKHKRI